MRALIEFCLTRRPMVLAILVVFLGAGYLAFLRLNIEAYPDPAPPMVELITQNPGASAEEIERYVTVPIEVGLAGMPGLKFTRSINLYGLSDIKFQFTYETDYNVALQHVLNRVAQLSLINNLQPQVSPESPVGEIFRYQLKGPQGASLTELKTLEDWVVERRFRTVPGVVDVVGWGGLTKEYHVDVDLKKLTSFNVGLPQLITNVTAANINVGARTLNIGQQAANVRGIGLIQGLGDIDNIVLTQQGGTPVLVRDVATSSVGYAQRLGIIGRDRDPDIVEGIVLMRRGEKTSEVLKLVQDEAARMNRSGELPHGVAIDTYYDRSELIGKTTRTVLESLCFGILLIVVMQYVFLGDLRTALVVAATIPFALFFAVMIMVARGASANLLSVGAIDFGIIVDSSVILVENIHRRMHTGSARFGVLLEEKQLFPDAPASIRAKLSRIFAAALEVDKAIFFTATIIIAAFIPLFTMQGVEGQIFAPMARTYGYALLGALIATFTITPVLSSLLLPEQVEDKPTIVVRWLSRSYRQVLTLTLKHRYVVTALAVIFLVMVGFVVPQLGTEFLPKLEEGNLWIRATLPPTISLEAGQPYVNQMREVISGYPEVKTVISQHGRPDDGTDPTGFYNAEFFAPLVSFEDKAAWQGLTKPEFIGKLQKDLASRFPGVDFNFSQNIEDNVQEAVSGVKGENSVKLFGPDLAVLEDKAAGIQKVLEKIQGIEEVGVFHQLGQPNLLIKVDRARCARFGLLPQDVNAVVQAAIGGQTATTIFEGERQFPLVVRLKPEYRQDIASIKVLPIPTAGGARVPLADVADINMSSGASYIYRENNRRYIPVKFSVRGRDLGSAVGEAQNLVEKRVRLPEGYRLEWAGEFGSLQEAQKRLAIIIPISLLLIVVLLYSLFNKLRDALMALMGIPFAVSGGILALWLRGLNFSISAAVGFVSLFGVAVMDGILMLTHYNRLRAEGHLREEAMTEAAQTCMRPILMATLSACIGLLPAALNTGIGSQTQKPLATVIVGGMLLAPFLDLAVVPVLRLVIMRSKP